MMQDKQQFKEFEAFFKSALECLKHLSPAEIAEQLTKISTQNSDKKFHIEFILNSVSAEFEISRRSLIYSAQRGNIQQAKQLAYCLLHFEVGLPVRYIGKRVFSVAHPSVVRALKRYNNINLLVPADREFKEKYEKLKRVLVYNLQQHSNNNDNEQRND